MHAQHQNLKIGPLGAQMLEQFDSTLARERDVEHDNIHLGSAIQQLERFLSRAGLADDFQVLFIGQHLADASAQDRVIVNNQHAYLFLHIPRGLWHFIFSGIEHQLATSMS